MKSLILPSLLLLLSCTNGRHIKIEIDPEDILKLLKVLMSSDMFKAVSDKLIQRSNLRKGMYNNPYHPEDDNVKKSSKTCTSKQIFDETRVIEEKLDKDNANYIINGDVSEDMLDSNDNNIFETTTVKPTNETNNQVNRNIKIKSDNTKLSDTENVKIIKKRYMLKN